MEHQKYGPENSRRIMFLGITTNWWNILLIISACAVAATTAGSIFAAKREAEEAKKELERDRAESNARIAEANARSDEAQLKIAELKLKTLMRQEDRHITDSQSQLIIEAVKPFSVHGYSFLVSNGVDLEQFNLAQELEVVFKLAGFEVWRSGSNQDAAVIKLDGPVFMVEDEKSFHAKRGFVVMHDPALRASGMTLTQGILVLANTSDINNPAFGEFVYATFKILKDLGLTTQKLMLVSTEVKSKQVQIIIGSKPIASNP